jgi:hypothetical protein
MARGLADGALVARMTNKRSRQASHDVNLGNAWERPD